MTHGILYFFYVAIFVIQSCWLFRVRKMEVLNLTFPIAWRSWSFKLLNACVKSSSRKFGCVNVLMTSLNCYFVLYDNWKWGSNLQKSRINRLIEYLLRKQFWWLSDMKSFLKLFRFCHQFILLSLEDNFETEKDTII